MDRRYESTVSVAMLMGNMGKGGVEAVVMNYIRNLADKDIHIEIILHDNSPFPQRREPEEFNVQFYAIPPYSRPLACHKVLLALFRRRRYTIVHAHISTMNLFPLLAAFVVETQAESLYAAYIHFALHTLGSKGDTANNRPKMPPKHEGV